VGKQQNILQIWLQRAAGITCQTGTIKGDKLLRWIATKEIADFGFECAATTKHHKRISARGLVETCTNASPSLHST
jgi:hypothetical protein